ncbi:winged helix-turn-helix domain-containing protein [Haloechinothrix salitolerans]|uniref:ArsR/SmtB family transcription factor n=1 Tax=Haloechinothrix salitolerans TaxID=926830 RepID=A0ABW2BVM6_9PSEU
MHDDTTFAAPLGDDQATSAQEQIQRLDAALLNPIRLLVMTALVTDGFYLVADLGEAAGLPRLAVTRHVRCLRDVGFVHTRRGVYGHLWIQRTPHGKQRVTDHVAELEAVIAAGRALGHAASPVADHPGPQTRD